MQNNNQMIITRKQAIDRILSSIQFTTDKEKQLATTLLMFHNNPTLSNMLGFINFVKSNSSEVVQSVIYSSIWNDLQDMHRLENFYINRTSGYAKYNDLIIK